MSGFFAVSRDLWMDRDFRDARMTEREAFLWLIAHAAFRDRDFDINGRVVALRRGQCAYSTRYLARAFQWPEVSVRRYLKHLKGLGVIDAPKDAARGAGLTVITLCNYEKYQSARPRGGAAIGAEVGAKQDKEDKNNNLMSNAPGPLFEELWSVWPGPGRKRSSKKKAGGAFRRASKVQAPDQILYAAKLYVRSPDAVKDGGQFAPGLHTWLSEERFEPWLETPTNSAAVNGAGHSTITPWRY